MAEGEADEPPWLGRQELAELVHRIGSGSALRNSDLEGLRYPPGAAHTLIDTSIRSGVGEIRLGGRIEGDLVLDRSVAAVIMIEDVAGSIDIDSDCEIDGGLSVRGTIAGDLLHRGEVQGGLAMSGTVAGDMRVVGAVSGDVLMCGTVMGDLAVGAVAGRVFVYGVVNGDLRVDGAAGGLSVTDGEIKRRSTLSGTAGHVLTVRDVVGARFGDEVLVGDYVDIEGCDFRRCPDLDEFSLVGSYSHLFPSDKGLLNEGMRARPDEAASINRQFRATLEGRRNRPASNLFYKGEMDARLRAARARATTSRTLPAKARGLSEWSILVAYKSLSGYGLVAWRAIAWFLVVAVVGALLYATSGLTLEVSDAGEETVASSAEVTVFTVRSMIAFFSPPEAELTVPQEWLQIALRFAGPILLAQAILALRERVAR